MVRSWKVDGQELEGRWSGRWSDIFDLFDLFILIFDLYLMVFDLFIRIYLSVLLSCCLDMLLTFEIKCTVRPFL
jgi:hypothetical protein